MNESPSARFVSPKWNICSLRQISSSFCFDLHQSGACDKEGIREIDSGRQRVGKLPEISLILNFLRENRRTWCDCLRDKNYSPAKISCQHFSELCVSFQSSSLNFSKISFPTHAKCHLKSGSRKTSPNFFMFNSQLFFNEIVKHRKVERKGFLERL